jgi:hypothetical protein
LTRTSTPPWREVTVAIGTPSQSCCGRVKTEAAAGDFLKTGGECGCHVVDTIAIDAKAGVSLPL